MGAWFTGLWPWGAREESALKLDQRTEREFREAQMRTTLAFISCGPMGYTLLDALLKASNADTVEDRYRQRISRYIATTQSAADTDRFRRLYPRGDARLLVYDSDHNLQAINQAGTIILAGRETDLYDLVLADGIPESLAGKLVITIDPSVTREGVLHMIQDRLDRKLSYCRQLPTVVRAIPNLAVNVGRGVTIVEEQNHAPLSREESDMVVWLFGRVGQVFSLSGPAFRSGVMMVTGGFGMISALMDGIFNCPLAVGLNKTERRRLARMVLDGLESNIDHGLGLENMRAFRTSWPSGPVTEALDALDRDGAKRIITDAMRFGIGRVTHTDDEDKDFADGWWISE